MVALVSIGNPPDRSPRRAQLKCEAVKDGVSDKQMSKFQIPGFTTINRRVIEALRRPAGLAGPVEMTSQTEAMPMYFSHPRAIRPFDSTTTNYHVQRDHTVSCLIPKQSRDLTHTGQMPAETNNGKHLGSRLPNTSSMLSGRGSEHSCSLIKLQISSKSFKPQAFQALGALR